MTSTSFGGIPIVLRMFQRELRSSDARWWIKRFHRRRASGVRVKRDAGHTSLSKALVNGIHYRAHLCLVQDNFLTQHVLEPTRATRIHIVLSSQKEFVDNVVIQELLGSSDHNQLHFNINIKSEKNES